MTAETFVRNWASYSTPVALRCDDGETYVVKGLQPAKPAMAHAIVLEQVLARLGRIVGAPVPEVVLVDVPQALIDVEPEIAFMSAGLAHGLGLVDNCSDKIGIEAVTSDRNRQAYGRLAVLDGWGHAWRPAADQDAGRGRGVWSVDHGLFAGGKNWTAASLAGLPSPAAPFPDLFAHADQDALDDALLKVHAVTDDALAGVIGWVRPSWGVPTEDLVALAKFLAGRRDTL